MANDLISLDDFPVGLAYDEAMNKASSTGFTLFTDDELCAQWDISQEYLDNVRQNPKFRIAVRSAMYDLKENGGTVRAKMRAQFEMHLDTTIPLMMQDEETSPAVKASLITMLGKGGGVLSDTKPKESEQQSQQNQVPPIQIIFASTPQLDVQFAPQEKVINPIKDN